jgi:hypothetical protein
LLPEKRNEQGIAQAHLAVDMARAYVRAEISSRGERAGLKLLVPVDAFRTTTAFHKRRWPDIQRDVEGKRQTLGALMRGRRGRERGRYRLGSS